MHKPNISQTQKDLLVIGSILLAVGLVIYFIIHFITTNSAYEAFKPIHKNILAQGGEFVCEGGNSGKFALSNTTPWYYAYYKFSDNDVASVLKKVNAAVRDEGFKFDKTHFNKKPHFMYWTVTQPKSPYYDSPGTIELRLDMFATPGEEMLACRPLNNDGSMGDAPKIKEGETYIELELTLPSRDPPPLLP